MNLVTIIYCQCGKRATTIGDIKYISKKDILEATKKRCKIETISFDDYKKMNIDMFCPEMVDEKKCPNLIEFNKNIEK